MSEHYRQIIEFLNTESDALVVTLKAREDEIVDLKAEVSSLVTELLARYGEIRDLKQDLGNSDNYDAQYDYPYLDEGPRGSLADEQSSMSSNEDL